ncbi:MAG: type I-G CRISPR-associated helicase/endonuclease Cas3g [Thermoguttaceae bacterium]
MENWKRIFKYLTGNEPFPWQECLYKQLVGGSIPKTCDIPTGLGKTMTIALWLIAIVEQSQSGRVTLPRRLVYVVDRRTVVDQSSEVIEKIRKKLQENSGGENFSTFQKTLKDFSNSEDFFYTSTLRGELSDDQRAKSQDWIYDPSALSISVATVDMAGSKLLFSGYGDSRRKRPLHAGLIGCDTLLIHDEAHLMPAFSTLLANIQQFADTAPNGIPRLQVMELSATSRQADDTAKCILTINEEDEANETVGKRLKAQKKITLHEVEEKEGKKGKNEEQIKEKIVKFITEDKNDFFKNLSAPNNRTVVFVRSPKDAAHICAELQKANKQAVLLTGQIRGKEREDLLKKSEMQPFLGNGTENQQPAFLVATSAAEVGWDLHADHYVGDLSTLDSMIQRLGRINRFGQVAESQIHIVHEIFDKKKGGDGDTDKKKKTLSPYDIARQQTLEIFKEIKKAGGDVSPLALRKYRDRTEAFSPKPEEKRLTDILLDFWSFTSIDDDIPARPEVADYLKGDTDGPPQTVLVWRSDVEINGLCSEDVTEEDVQTWFEKNRIKSQERLSMPTYDLPFSANDSKKKTTPWVEKHADKNVIMIRPNSGILRTKLGKLDNQQLKFATLIFPVSACGLTPDGTFDPKTETAATDVSDAAENKNIYELRRLDGIFEYRILGDKFDSLEGNNVRQTIKNIANAIGKKYVFHFQTQAEDETADVPESRWLVLLTDKVSTDSQTASEVVTLDNHHEKTAEIMRGFCERLGLSEQLSEALILAAKYHDLGKRNEKWQRAAGNDDLENPIAKSKDGFFNGHALNGYRHELGSVREAAKVDEINNHELRDLILHVIAAHHGWSRPHFLCHLDAGAKNTDFADEIYEQKLIFATLQKRFGWWGLAWLESLLRRADGIASE